MEKIFWYTQNGQKLDIKIMTNTHIINTFNCLYGLGNSEIPQKWFGKDKDEWKSIFENELIIRGYKIVMEYPQCKYGIIKNN